MCRSQHKLAADGGWIVGDVCARAPLASESNYARHVKEAHFGLIGRSEQGTRKWIRSAYFLSCLGAFADTQTRVTPWSSYGEGKPQASRGWGPTQGTRAETKMVGKKKKTDHIAISIFNCIFSPCITTILPDRRRFASLKHVQSSNERKGRLGHISKPATNEKVRISRNRKFGMTYYYIPASSRLGVLR